MQVTALNDANEKAPALDVATAIGVLRGVWRGHVSIRAGETLDVELELRRPRRWSDLTADADVLTESVNSGSVIRGTVVQIFEDGAVALQIGTAAVLLEMSDEAANVSVGTSIVLFADDLEFHPTEV